MIAISTKQGQTGFCAADIAYQNHAKDRNRFKVGLATPRRKSPPELFLGKRAVRLNRALDNAENLPKGDKATDGATC